MEEANKRKQAEAFTKTIRAQLQRVLQQLGETTKELKTVRQELSNSVTEMLDDGMAGWEENP